MCVWVGVDRYLGVDVGVRIYIYIYIHACRTACKGPKNVYNKYFELKNSWGADGAPLTRTTC